MKILVTGAEGFVGRHLVKELEAHGHRVTPTDIGDADLAIPGRAERLIDTQPDYVVHLAARYGRLLCADEPHRAVTDNASATAELAATCAGRGIRVLYTSSSEVYGDHGEDTITEDTELRMPTTIYGLSKLWGEQVLELYLPPEKLCIVRMNMLYGPGQAAGYGRCALATFIDSALRGKSFTVHRNASRSWLYIADAVRALRLLIEGGVTGVFNLGNESERTPMVSLAEMVCDEVGDGAHYSLAVAPATQIRHKVFDCSKLKRTIDWRPEVPLAEGISQTILSARRVAFTPT